MTTSKTPFPAAQATAESQPRVPLRLRLADPGVQNTLDGAWWPQSRDLALELADLVDHFPSERGQVARVLFSPPDWDPSPRRVPVARGYVKVGSFPGDDTHLMTLAMSDHSRLQILVVPPEFDQDQGEEALLAAATRRNAHSAADLLNEVTNQPAVDPGGHWSDHGGDA